ncbi:hypothetical protein [Neobacillus drentensis]|uniref:hypothetical protein n=1 Tax=Neobacillus drentensis TaxID=220684 RepID=UPI002FFE9877
MNSELLKLREELFRGKQSEVDQTETPPPHTDDYRQKLGLSKRASDKEVITRYKKLLKITHPDHGGNAAAFHFIKTDYNRFRHSIKIK